TPVLPAILGSGESEDSYAVRVVACAAAVEDDDRLSAPDLIPQQRQLAARRIVHVLGAIVVFRLDDQGPAVELGRGVHIGESAAAWESVFVAVAAPVPASADECRPVADVGHQIRSRDV